MEVGETYNPLPSHLTLMSRFWSQLPPHALAHVVKPLFERTKRVVITFGNTAHLGPQHVAVHMIEPSPPLYKIHENLRRQLINNQVEFEYPQFVGDGFKAHVSKRPKDIFKPGLHHEVRAVYLIEVMVQGEKHVRYIRERFELQ